MIAPSRRKMTSEIAVRRIRLRVAAVAAGMRPGALEIGTERDELLPLRLTKRRRTPRDHGRDGNRLQSLVPSALQLAGDEPIGWINSIVLSTGMGDLITGLL